MNNAMRRTACRKRLSPTIIVRRGGIRGLHVRVCVCQVNDDTHRTPRLPILCIGRGFFLLENDFILLRELLLLCKLVVLLLCSDH